MDELGGSRELIVIARADASLRASGETVASAAGANTESIERALRSAGATMLPLFGPTEERVRHSLTAAAPAGGVPDLSVYYQVQAPDESLDALASELASHDAVEAAYVKPPSEPPQLLNDMAPQAEAPPAVTPDFSPRQTYLDAAPVGVDARWAWTQSGGFGAGIDVIDLEWDWNFSHEDLLQNSGGVVGGTAGGGSNHGTAVLGEIGSDHNSIGVMGIAPEANLSSVAFSMASSAAIRLAADRLNAGDIILLEIHRAGPRNNFQARADQLGYIAIEWWPDDFDAILYATGRGVIVVEAAGNGAENLDDAIYSTRPAGFPATWTNPFNRSNRDSGAIVVGAGAPPAGTHGRDHGPDRSRLGFSNYGALIDAQGWGREVTTSGYGDLQGGSDMNVWYTDTFSGTSSASPIVVGVLASAQGVLQAQGRPLLTPARARQCLRTTGSAQQDAPGRPATQRIGNRPDLRQLIPCAVGGGKSIKAEIKDGVKEKVEAKERVEIKGRKAEKIEIKERKAEKIEIKDHKLELKERKIEKVEGKDLKERKPEFEKGIREFDKGIREVDVRLTPSVSAEERLTLLEQTVEELAHFIGIDLRPDLSSGALAGEGDLTDQALHEESQRLEKEAVDAKQAKDAKDVEKLRER
jgi:hypothetical protein